MRVSVMELGRFTGHTANLTRLKARKPALPNYPPLRRAKAIKVKEIMWTGSPLLLEKGLSRVGCGFAQAFQEGYSCLEQAALMGHFAVGCQLVDNRR